MVSSGIRAAAASTGLTTNRIRSTRGNWMAFARIAACEYNGRFSGSSVLRAANAMVAAVVEARPPRIPASFTPRRAPRNFARKYPA